MKIYKDDSDEFRPDYLAYLATLTSEVRDLQGAKMRVSRNPRGDIVRIEIWIGEESDDPSVAYGYYNLHTKEWRK